MTTKTDPIVDSKGTELEVGYRVTTTEGFKAAVTRIDRTSRRAVVVFEDVDGEPPLQPTMRAAHRLTVIKNKGKISKVKAAVKAGAKEKASA